MNRFPAAVQAQAPGRRQPLALAMLQAQAPTPTPEPLHRSMINRFRSATPDQPQARRPALARSRHWSLSPALDRFRALARLLALAHPTLALPKTPAQALTRYHHRLWSLALDRLRVLARLPGLAHPQKSLQRSMLNRFRPIAPGLPQARRPATAPVVPLSLTECLTRPFLRLRPLAQDRLRALSRFHCRRPVRAGLRIPELYRSYQTVPPRTEPPASLSR